MEKLKIAYSFLLGLNISHLCVIGIILKAIISDISYASFLVTIPVLAYECYKLYIKSKTPDPVKLNQEVQKNIDYLKEKVNAISMEKNLTQPAKRYF